MIPSVPIPTDNIYKITCLFGLALSWYGATKWHSEIQRRDDKLAALYLQKLEAEVFKLRAEIGKTSGAAEIGVSVLPEHLSQHDPEK